MKLKKPKPKVLVFLILKKSKCNYCDLEGLIWERVQGTRIDFQDSDFSVVISNASIVGNCKPGIGQILNEKIVN